MSLEATETFAEPESPSRLLVGLAVALPIVIVVAAGIGAVSFSPLQVVAVFASRLGLALPVSFDAVHEAVLFDVRLPRIVLALLVGGGLAAAGAALQGLLRNPLVEPGLIGASSGAAFAAALVIVLGGALVPSSGLLGAILLPVVSFVGAMGATWLVQALARGTGQTDVSMLLLLGVAVNAFAGTGIGLLTFIADDVQVRTLAFWTLGSLGSASWKTNAAVACLAVPSLVLLVRTARQLNLIALGEREAGHLGLDVERLKRQVVVFSSLCVGAAVSAAGSIGFVGLIVPHVLRLSGGPDQRLLVPGSALGGALLVVLADLVSRTVVAPAELPIGVVTSLLGAPVFFVLVLRRGRTAAT